MRWCASWWGLGGLGVGLPGPWDLHREDRGEGIMGGSGHLVVAGDLDTSEAPSLPSTPGLCPRGMGTPEAPKGLAAGAAHPSPEA